MQSDPLFEPDDCEEVGSDGTTGPYAALKARYERLQRIGLRAQNTCDDLASHLERVQVRFRVSLHKECRCVLESILITSAGVL